MAQLECTAVAAAVQGELSCLGGWANHKYLTAQLLATDEKGTILPADGSGRIGGQRDCLR